MSTETFSMSNPGGLVSVLLQAHTRGTPRTSGMVGPQQSKRQTVQTPIQHHAQLVCVCVCVCVCVRARARKCTIRGLFGLRPVWLHACGATLVGVTGHSSLTNTDVGTKVRTPSLGRVPWGYPKVIHTPSHMGTCKCYRGEGCAIRICNLIIGMKLA